MATMMYGEEWQPALLGAIVPGAIDGAHQQNARGGRDVAANTITSTRGRGNGKQRDRWSPQTHTHSAGGAGDGDDPAPATRRGGRKTHGADENITLVCRPLQICVLKVKRIPWCPSKFMHILLFIIYWIGIRFASRMEILTWYPSTPSRKPGLSTGHLSEILKEAHEHVSWRKNSDTNRILIIFGVRASHAKAIQCRQHSLSFQVFSASDCAYSCQPLVSEIRTCRSLQRRSIK